MFGDQPPERHVVHIGRVTDAAEEARDGVCQEIGRHALVSDVGTQNDRGQRVDAKQLIGFRMAELETDEERRRDDRDRCEVVELARQNRPHIGIVLDQRQDRPCRHRVKGKLLAWPAHNLKEIRAGERSHADFILLSPLFPTRSHPSVKALGCLGFAKLVRATALPVIALGGVRREDQRRLLNLGAYGWAAIDGLTPANPGRQKRKAVPM